MFTEKQFLYLRQEQNSHEVKRWVRKKKVSDLFSQDDCVSHSPKWDASKIVTSKQS